MPEDTELEQGYRDRVTKDRQKVVDDVSHDIVGFDEAQRWMHRGTIEVDVRAGEKGPFRETQPTIPGATRAFTDRPLPKAQPKETPRGPASRDFGPILPGGRRLFDQYFENFKTDLLNRIDPHQGITADNYDFEALYQNPEARDEFQISRSFGKLLLPEKFRKSEPALPPAQLLESITRQKNEALERGEINALSPGEQAVLFNRLQNFLDQPLPDIVSQKKLEEFKEEQGRRRFQRPSFRRDPRDVPGFGEQTINAGLNKLASRFPRAIKAGGDAIRSIEIGKDPKGKPFTTGDLFKVFGVDEVIEVPKVKEERPKDPVVDIASEFFAIATAFLLLKGTGAPGVTAPLVVAEAGTLDTDLNFANLIQQLEPEAESLILDFLAAQPEDGDFAKLAKALVTDVAVPSVIVEGIIKAVQAIRRTGGLRALQNEQGAIQFGPGKPQGEDFEKFFKESKIVDENDEPLVMFHGTTKDFKEFSNEKINSRFEGSLGFHFTDRPTEAALQASGPDIKKLAGGTNIRPVFLSIKNPLIIQTDELAASMEFDLNKGPILEKLTKAKDAGKPHDGVIIKRERGDEFDGVNVVVFDEKQIRSTFDFDQGIPDQVQKERGFFDALRGEIGAIDKGRVGKILKGETENIPEEVVRRIAGLKGRHIDIGGRLSINWSIVPERAKVAIKIVREKFEDEIAAAVPVRPRTTPVLEARARIEADLDAEIYKFMGRDFQKISPNDTDIVVVNWIADDAALQLYKLQEATLADVPGANFEFLKMLALNADVQKQRQLMSATTARTFRANGIAPELTGVPFETRDYAKEAAGFAENLPPGVDAKVIAQRMKNTIISPEGAATLDRQTSDAMTRGRFSAAFLEYWINSLLSGPQTQAVNIASNAVFAAWQVPERMLAAGVSTILRTQDGVRIRESVSQMHGAIEGMTDGFQVLSYNINRAFNPFKLGDVEVSISQKLEGARENAISSKNFKSWVDEDGSPNTLGITMDYAGEIIRTPGKLLMTFDEWFKGIGYRMELRAQAMRFALQQFDDGVENFAQRIVQQEVADLGLKGEKAIAHAQARRTEILADNGTAELNKFYQATVDNPPPWITSKAVDAATYQTFTNELGPIGKKATALLNSHPAFRLVIPFFRTPVQLLSRNLERTPLGLITALRKKGAERDIALARVAMGSASMAWAFNMASKGRITGNGPVNFKAKAWLRTNKIGWQPNSFVTFKEDGKKVYTSINRLDPFGSWLTMAADMQMMWGYLDEEERQDLASAAVLSLRNNVLSKTWFRGLAEATTAMQLNDPGRFIAQFAGSNVPNIGATFEREREGHLQDTRTKDPTAGIGSVFATTTLKDILNLPDTEITRPGGTHASLVLFERVLRKMKTRVPWMDNDDAPPDVDVWGEVRVLQGGWGPDIISPFWQSFEKNDPAAQEFINNKVDVGPVGATIRGVRLTPKEKFRYAQLAGNLLKDEELGNLGAHDYLNQLIKTPEYLILTKGKGGGRAHLLRSTLLAFRKKAALQVIAETDRLKTALSVRLSNKQEKLTGQPGGQKEILQSINEQTLNLQVR